MWLAKGHATALFQLCTLNSKLLTDFPLFPGILAKLPQKTGDDGIYNMKRLHQREPPELLSFVEEAGNGNEEEKFGNDF